VPESKLEKLKKVGVVSTTGERRLPPERVMELRSILRNNDTSNADVKPKAELGWFNVKVKQSLKCWTEPKLLPNTLRPGVEIVPIFEVLVHVAALAGPIIVSVAAMASKKRFMGKYLVATER
jgi:hypothetical protein